jgi:nitrite reductase/ring-hydroxylating ferredoxin subunit
LSEQILCRLEDVDDGQSGGYALTHNEKLIGVMVIRQGDTVYTYRNSCPHIGTPLDFMPGKFLDKSREHILCSTHGALFRIEDGHCISGPCAGGALTPIKATVRDDIVYVELDA